MAELSFRHRMDERSAAAALIMAGHDDHGPLLDGLPAVSEPGSELAGSDLVDASGALRPDVVTALGVLARPSRVVTVVATSPSRGDDTGVLTMAGSSDGWVALGRDGAVDMAFSPTDTLAGLLVDDLLMLTTFPGEAGEPIGELDAVGWAGLLTAADADHEQVLLAQLDRVGRENPSVLTAEALERMLQLGLDRSDTRWAATSLASLAPVDLSVASGRMGEALAALAGVGLVVAEGSDFRLSDRGRVVSASIRNSAVIGNASLALVEGNDRIRVAELTIVRSAMRILVGAWKTVDGEARVMLLEPDPTDAFRLVVEMMGLAAS